MITIIAAITRDHALGRGGDMIYHISADLKRFKQITMGHPVVMGRRTYESLPRGPLPGRRNLVITRNPDSVSGDATAPDTTLETYSTLEEAIEAAGPDPMIIGGGQIYAQAMPLADALEITEIDAEAPDADTHFPAIGPDWRPVAATPWQTDPRTSLRFRHVTYSRQ